MADNANDVPDGRQPVTYTARAEIDALMNDWDPPPVAHDECQMRIDALEDELRERKKELAWLRRRLSAVHKSRSWRLTAPLRVAGACLKTTSTDGAFKPKTAKRTSAASSAQPDKAGKANPITGRVSRGGSEPSSTAYAAMHRVYRLEKKLWGGFSTAAEAELRQIMRSRAPGGRAQAAAAWTLARLAAFRGNYQQALDYVVLARTADKARRGMKAVLLLEAAALSELRHADEAVALLASRLTRGNFDSNICMALAAAHSHDHGDPDKETKQLSTINRVFLSKGFAPIEKADPGQPLSIYNLAAPHAHRLAVNGLPLISVIMPAYNAEDTIGIAFESLLAQTWSNLEIIAVDDCSSDNTFRVIQDFAARDPRVVALRHEQNRGAYSARNTALHHARGDFITTHDSDDWSHPEKLATQVRSLQAEPELIGTVSYWCRTNRRLAFHGPAHPSSQYIQWNHSSLLFRRSVLDQLGGWDPVRVAGDTEFIWRLTAAYGEDAVRAVVPDVPLQFALGEPGCLTRSVETSVSTIHFGLRREYREAARHWHSTAANAESLWVNPASSDRKFPAPVRNLPGKPGTPNYDLLVIMDFSLAGGAFHSTYNYLLAARSIGLRVAAFHWRRYDQDVVTPVNCRLRELQAAGEVDVITPGDELRARHVLVGYPPILSVPIDKVPRVEFDSFAIITNQMAARLYSGSDPQYDPLLIRENLRALFGTDGTWLPISGHVRMLMQQDGRYPDPGPDDWIPLIDLDTWCSGPVGCRNGEREQPVVGRHGRDHYTKWPQSREVLRDAYCADRPCEVRILGGAAVAEERLGERPQNWVVYGFGKMNTYDFVRDLDFFVQYPHENYIEEFGRSVLEAMAAGVPAVLPPRFSDTFGEAALYASAADVWPTISRVWSNADAYRLQAEKGRAFVRRNSAFTVLERRLRRLEAFAANDVMA